MAESKHKERCAYCGTSGQPLTRDHIPPRAVFPDDESYRRNLITVPACRPCHKGFSQDDQYFHILIAAHAQTGANPISETLHARALRSVTHTLRDRIGRMISRSLRRVEVRTPAGVYIGTAPAIEIDRAALDRVAKRILRGLYYHHNHQPVPTHLAVDCRFLRDMALRTADDNERIQRMRDMLQSAPVHNVGGGVFMYRFTVAVDNPEYSVWMMIFYDAMEFVGAIRPQDSISRIVLPQ